MEQEYYNAVLRERALSLLSEDVAGVGVNRDKRRVRKGDGETKKVLEALRRKGDLLILTVPTSVGELKRG
jgi:hypothetical protein